MYSKVPKQGWVPGKLRNQALHIVRTLTEKLGWKLRKRAKMECSVAEQA